MERSLPSVCDEWKEAQVGEARTEKVEYRQRRHGVLVVNAGLGGRVLLFGTGTCNRPRIVIRTRRETAELYTAGKHAVITCRVCVRARARARQCVCVCPCVCMYV